MKSLLGLLDEGRHLRVLIEGNSPFSQYRLRGRLNELLGASDRGGWIVRDGAADPFQFRQDARRVGQVLQVPGGDRSAQP